MGRIAIVLLALAAALGSASCGGSADGGTASSTTANESPSGDLMGCLLDAGFAEPANFVATVEVEGVSQITTVAFPPPHGEDDFLVVYEAPNQATAAKAAKDFTGGPFMEQVGARLYTVAGANDPLTDAQTKAIQRCLKTRGEAVRLERNLQIPGRPAGRVGSSFVRAL